MGLTGLFSGFERFHDFDQYLGQRFKPQKSRVLRKNSSARWFAECKKFGEAYHLMVFLAEYYVVIQ